MYENISFMAMFAAFLLTGCKQDAQVKFAGEEGAKVTFSASINEQNAQDVSRVTGVTWDDGDEVSISLWSYTAQCIFIVTMQVIILLPLLMHLMRFGYWGMKNMM